MATLPNENREYKQPNDGSYRGNVYATFGMDLSRNRGIAEVSGNQLVALDESTESNFDQAATTILSYKSRIYATGLRVYNSTTPDGTWAQAGSQTIAGNYVADAVVFNDLLLVADTDTIRSYDGSSWANWWETTRSQSPLDTSETHLLEVGPDRNLYIVDGGNKLYKVDKDNTIAPQLSGAGTLDFSDTRYIFTCMESNSTRLWIGTEETDGNEAVIIEWDVSATSTSPNKVHKIGSTRVMCIAIWNDTPIAILRNGKIKYHNGASFVDYPGAQLPFVDEEESSRDDFIHYNGWAIIDGLPHFLIKGSLLRGSDTLDFNTSSPFNFYSGVYCLDPEIGLYNRYTLGTGRASQVDYGHPSVFEVGALFALGPSLSYDEKLMCSFENYEADGDTSAILSYLDVDRTKPTRAFMATSFLSNLKGNWQQVEMWFKSLNAGESIRVWLRSENKAPVRLEGTWQDANTISCTSSSADIAKGDLVVIKNGSGAGQLVRIADFQQGASIVEITLEEDVLSVSAGDTTVIDVYDFKRIKVINGTTVDSESFGVPENIRKRKGQFLFEYRQNAGSTMEQEYCIIKE